MAYFEVVRTDKEKTVLVKKTVRDEHGNNVVVQDEVDKTFQANAYGHEDINVGDVLEINGHLAEKARRNPYFKEVKGKDIEARQPNARPTFEKTRKGSDEWLQQRAQYRQH